MLLTVTLGRRLAAEALGTGFLLAVVVGSGIMGERLAGGNVAVALLANSIATGAGLVALILVLGPISGAHFNPVVSMVAAHTGGMRWRHVPSYMAAQVVGALAGVMVAHVMFGLALVSPSQHARGGLSQLVAEGVATFGLVAVVISCARQRVSQAALAVGTFITAAYWFTSSTSFANPAVTLARAATDTFSGIRPEDVPAFVIAQLAGAGGATLLFGWLVPAAAVSPGEQETHD